MSIIIDVVIAVFIIACIIVGYLKGLTGCLIRIISFVLSIIIAFVLFVPISNLVIDNTQFDERIEYSIKDMVAGNKDSTATEMPETINEYIEKEVKKVGNEAKNTVVERVSHEVALTIVRAGTWVGLFVAAKILLICLEFITSLISKLPVIHQFDKAGGVIYGTIEGLIITYSILAIISFITPMTKGNLAKSINESYLGKQMYNNNLLIDIVF